MSIKDAYRQPGDSGAFPPRTIPPANASMAQSFDKLVDSNLRLVAIVRLALLMLVIFALLTVYATWTMKTTVISILENVRHERCKE